MPKKASRPAIAGVMEKLVANRSRGYRVTHDEMMGFLAVLAANWLEWPASLATSLMQREYLCGMIDRWVRARDMVLAMPLAPWVYARGNAVFEPVLMVPAVGCEAA